MSRGRTATGTGATLARGHRRLAGSASDGRTTQPFEYLVIGLGLGTFPEPGVSIAASTIDAGVFRVESNHLGEIRHGAGVIALVVTRQAPEV